MENPSFTLRIPITSLALLFSLIVSYLHCISKLHHWDDCTIDMQRTPFNIILNMLKLFGSYISTLHITGAAPSILRNRVHGAIQKYCTHLNALDSFGVPYLISVTGNTTSFAISFPSCASDYHTLNTLNSKNVMYLLGDYIEQTMEIFDQDLSEYTRSIWQISFKNDLVSGVPISFQFRINDNPIYSMQVTTNGEPFYYLNLSIPIPREALSKRFHNLTLSFCCTSSLSLGSGFVTISSVGRVFLLKASEFYTFVETVVPRYVSP